MTEQSSLPPPLPADWTRCHHFLENKNRYCRQQLVKGTNYCGNHLVSSTRIPCPLDPSHLVDAASVEKHVKICPFAKRKSVQQQEAYYKKNVNCGGHGQTESETTTTAPSNNNTVEWARNLALQILQVHQKVFTGETINTQNVSDLTYQNIVDAIPSMDLSADEVERLQESVDHYRIKCGGTRHLHQQASLVGHLRRLGVFSFTGNLQFIEMGAGRGMLGLMAAGVAAKHAKVKLILVEKSGSRSKADSVLRMAKDETNDMALNRVNFSRIACDLAHVDMETVVETNNNDTAASAAAGVKRKLESNKSKTVVIAKHLCGAGTDLALKSIRNISIDACVMATCCHGVCCFDAYVGRGFLKRHFGNDFGRAEFELLRRWTSGTVLKENSRSNGGNKQQKDEEQEHGKCAVDDKKDSLNVSAIVKSLGLEKSLGPQGLGRACQRLLDQGRLEYMRNVLFEGKDVQVEMFHYVPSSVTPQNAVLVAYRKNKAYE